MPDFSFSSTSNSKNNNDFSALLFHFCFSIFSHPLYFSYFIFFSPYILKLVSFLSPLFITTTLLLLALFTVSPSFLVPDKTDSEFSDSKMGFLLSNFQTLIEWLHSKGNEKDEEVGYLEEFEAYLVMFQASIFQALEAKTEENCSQGIEANPVENNGTVAEARSLESLFQESEEFEDLSRQEEESEAKPLDPKLALRSAFKVMDAQVSTKGDGEMKVLESLFQEDEEFEDLVHQKEENEAKLVDPLLGKSEEEDIKGKLGLRNGFKVMKGNGNLDGKGEMKVLESLLQEKEEHQDLTHQKEENEESKGKLGLRSGFRVKMGSNRSLLGGEMKMSKSQRLLEASLGSPENNWVYSESNYLGSFGSMRKEKEWRRTLACKLFEERHNNVNGRESEGMDSLWETYETESNKKKVLEKSKTKKGKKSEVKYYEEEEEEEEDEEEEEEDATDGKLCCLQALKFSAGKMNLGMGRPNLVKISKAFKGIGWLHHVGRHGRKG